MIVRFLSLLILLLAAAGVLYIAFVDVPVTQTEIKKEVRINAPQPSKTETP